MSSKSNANFAVVGAGVVGSTVARLLQERYRSASVAIIADQFHADTVSAVAAGIFRPGTSFQGPTPEITKKWVHDSWHYWRDIFQSPESTNAGLMELSTYVFSRDNPHVTKNHLIENLVPDYRAATEEELKTGQGWKYGVHFKTMKIDTMRYLPWAEKQFRANGGRIIEKKIDSLDSLSGYDIVFNCTGLGAKTLCDDHDLVPIRGQVTRVRAPWVTSAYYGDYDAYIVPGLDGVVTLGGTRQYDSYNRGYCRHDAAAIMERCLELVPSLARAAVVAHRVGLRPHRAPVRVEPGVGAARTVHCYGHGGYGVTCAPGTALHALDLADQLLRTNTRPKL